MEAQPHISAEFAYESKYVTVHDVRLHYVEAGAHEPPVLLLHGIPTHAYLWRNVIPHIAPYAWTLALDLIGFGKSDKPLNINYDLPTYTRYLEGAIEALNLRNLIVVAMDLGAIVGLNYAMQHEANIKGLVIFEGFLLPPDVMFGAQTFTARFMMELFRIKKFAEYAIVRSGTMVDQMMAAGTVGTVRKLSEEELDQYRAPLSDAAVRRKVLLEGIGPNTLRPKSKHAGDLADLICQYTNKLATSPIPKLLLYATPGAAITEKVLTYAREHVANLEIKHIGVGKHFLPEDQPDAVGHAITEFQQRLAC
jgi:haloalkane dehalogenase